jgi:hypothetical protein
LSIIGLAMRAGHNGLTTIPARPVLPAPSPDIFTREGFAESGESGNRHRAETGDSRTP